MSGVEEVDEYGCCCGGGCEEADAERERVQRAETEVRRVTTTAMEFADVAQTWLSRAEAAEARVRAVEALAKWFDASPVYDWGSCEISRKIEGALEGEAP